MPDPTPDTPHLVYLIPGFFGFTQLGTLNYFHRVASTLGEALRQRGVEARIIEVETRPTSSIRRRALALLDSVAATGGLQARSLHFIGHSTGGLDVRLMLTPGVRLSPSDLEPRIAARTASAISLSTPHFGTPLASFFTSINGRNVLFLLTTMVTSQPGRLLAWLVARSITRLARLDDLLGKKNTALDTFSRQLLQHVRPERGDDLWRFLRQVASDQGAMVQLMPEAVDVFNASVIDHQDIDYASFVSLAPPPEIRPAAFRHKQTYDALSKLLFTFTWTITSRERQHYPYPLPRPEILSSLRDAFPFPLDSTTNDGIVPSLSQIWGRLAGFAVADHLDVVGQFPQQVDGRPYAGWLYSGSYFRREHFQALWESIADVIRDNLPPG